MSSKKIILGRTLNLILCNIINNADKKSMNNVWLKEDGKITLKDLIADYLRHLKEHINHFEKRHDEIQKSI
jgi:Na+/phosphate symporter